MKVTFSVFFSFFCKDIKDLKQNENCLFIFGIIDLLVHHLCVCLKSFRIVRIPRSFSIARNVLSGTNVVKDRGLISNKEDSTIYFRQRTFTTDQS